MHTRMQRGAAYIELFRALPRYRSSLRHGLELSIPNLFGRRRNLGETLASFKRCARASQLTTIGETTAKAEGSSGGSEKSRVASIFSALSWSERKSIFSRLAKLYFAQENRGGELGLNKKKKKRKRR